MAHQSDSPGQLESVNIVEIKHSATLSAQWADIAPNRKQIAWITHLLGRVII